VTFLFALIIAPFTLLTFCFAVELFAGLRPLRQKAAPESRSVAAVIVVPAHDEETVIGRRLPDLKAAAGRARILLVADNCRDQTAEIARNLGVKVIERFDDERRGKGFALDFARRELEAKPPEVIVIIDADCVTDAQSLERLIACCASTGRPCQATNLQAPALGSPPSVQLSTFAFFIKNVIRQRALQRIAGSGHLLGTGMALPWTVFAEAKLATDNIVEDLAMGVELAEVGHRPLFVEQATVWSDPESEKNTLAQRRRWEGGFLQNAIRSGPRLLIRNVVRCDARGIWAAINVVIPPFALLLLLDFAVLLFCCLGMLWIGAAAWPLILLAGSVTLASIGLIAAWALGGSKFVTLRALAEAPFYLGWKLPLYLGLVRRGAPKEWLRTRGSDS
jgi:cellulose synthase/poly-beta-1,6-N-acetylglucosamine synthase-like glycosyltransferase